MRSIRRWFRTWKRVRAADERGATFVLTAISMVLLLWAGAFGVDLGFTVDGNRQAQAIADTAALDVTRYINIADQQATLQASNTYLAGELANANTDNGNDTSLSFVGGVWSGSPATFSPATGGCWDFYPQYLNPCNAVKVTATQTVPHIFGGGSSTVTRSSIAELTPEGGFSVGSYLANISTTQSQPYAVLSDVLGTMAPNISISAAGYQGLADTYVSLNQVIQADASVLTPANVLTTSLPESEWPTLLNDAITNQVQSLNCGASPAPPACVASQALSSSGLLSAGGSTMMSLCQLVSISWNQPSSGDTSSCTNGEIPTSALGANLNVLQLLTTEAEVANGSNEIDVTSALGITGLTTADLQLQVGQLPVVAFGPVGTQASTVQVTANITLNIPGLGSVTIGPLSAAGATSTLSAVSCTNTNNTFSAAKVNSSTQTASAGVSIPGYSGVSVQISGVTSASETYNSSNVPPSASTYGPSGSNPKQIGTASPTPSFTGLGATNPAYAVLTTLAPVMVPVLQVAGVSVGNAEVAFLAANCDSVSLVQ